MVKYYDLSLRNRAIGMIEAGMSQSQVARKVSAHLRTVQRWWKQFKTHGTVADRPRSGRPTSLSMVAKLVMKKAVGKRIQSATKLAQRLTRKGHSVSDRSIRRFWKKEMGLKAYKIRTRPKLTEKQVSDRIKFCKKNGKPGPKKTGKTFYSATSPPLSCFIHQIARMTAFGLPTQSVYPQLLPSNSQRS